MPVPFSIKAAWGLAAAICLLPLPAAAQPSGGDAARAALLEPETIARDGEERITASQLRTELARRAERGAPAPRSEGELRELLAEMARHRVLLAAARAAGYDQRPELLEIWERMLVRAYLQDELDTRLDLLAVGDDEVAAHFAAHQADYAVPGRRLLAIVFYRAAAGADAEPRAEALRRAEAALAEAAGLPASIRHFGEIARRDSDHRESRFQGGVVGYLDDAADPAAAPLRFAGLPAELIAAARGLERPGELAQLIATAEGFYLLRLVEREAPRGQPLERVAAGIRHRLLGEKRAAARSAFEERLSAGVEIDAGRLHELATTFALPIPPPLPVESVGAAAGNSP